MSAPSSRPPVPRPTVRKTTSIPPSSPAIEVRKAYASEPPVIRDRMPTLELADDDLVVEAVVAPRRSTPPPPPPIRSTVAPKLRAIGDAPVEMELPKIAPLEPLPTIAAVVAAPVSAVQLMPAPVQVIQPQPVAAAVVKPKLESVVDPSEALFEGMYDLNYADSQWAAARVCAGVLGRALGARTVIVHLHDLATHELRAIGVHGDGEFDLLGCSDASDDDLVASAVICNEKPVTMRFDGELPRLAPRRLGLIRAPRTLVAVPAMAWGRCVAVIEIIDADERFAARVADSGAYVAERLAAFLSNRVAA